MQVQHTYVNEAKSNYEGCFELIEINCGDKKLTTRYRTTCE